MFTLPAQITNGSWLCYCSWVPFCFSNWCSMPATPTLVTSTASVYRAYVSRCSQVSYQDPGYTKTPTHASARWTESVCSIPIYSTFVNIFSLNSFFYGIIIFITVFCIEQYVYWMKTIRLLHEIALFEKDYTITITLHETSSLFIA